MPKGTTAQRPTGVDGGIRLNTTTKEPEWYDQRDSYTKADKEWVTKLLKDVGLNDLTTLCREDMKHCNQLWRDYERNK